MSLFWGRKTENLAPRSNGTICLQKSFFFRGKTLTSLFHAYPEFRKFRFSNSYSDISNNGLTLQLVTHFFHSRVVPLLCLYISCTMSSSCPAVHLSRRPVCPAAQFVQLYWSVQSVQSPRLDNWTPGQTGRPDNCTDWGTGQLDNCTSGHLDNWTTGQLDR